MLAQLDQPTRFLFFTGKGGVGKTALSSATAIRLADRGRRVLLVSTDPASNLDEMLETTIGSTATPVAGVDHLFAMNIDPDRAAEAYRRRVIDPYRGAWTDAQLDELREQLSGACTTEIAAFDEFSGLLAGDETSLPYDHVLFDTAPTGHTLRLLSLPRAWTTFLASAPQGASCLGPHGGLKMQEERFAAAVAALADGKRTTVVLVARPERAALAEAARTSAELEALGLRNHALVVNAVFRASDRSDPVALALEERGRAALREQPPRLRALPSMEVPLRPFDVVGLRTLRAVFEDPTAVPTRPAATAGPADLPPLRTLVDDLAAAGHGLVLVMGKGGVGKTTIASAIAAELASRGHRVHLSTTDPAAHVAATIAGRLEHLTVSRIDPAAERQAYVDRVMATRGAKLDEQGRALLAEDLRSPCYEEVAVFSAFSRIVTGASSSFVILDTAPTGHTVLLLDATGAYHRQMVSGERPAQRIVTPLMRLRDPDYTKVLVVTLAETTPVSEAAWLQEDLRRANIEPYAWIINESLAATGTTDPCLEARMTAELAQVRRVREQYANRIAVVPWMREAPVGPTRLLALARGAADTSPAEATGTQAAGPSST